MIPFLLNQSISKPPENRTTNPNSCAWSSSSNCRAPTLLWLPLDARCAVRTIKVNLRSALLIRWHKNESPGVLFVTLMMGKGNTPVLGSGRIHDFSETKSGNRSRRQPTIQQRQGFSPNPVELAIRHSAEGTSGSLSPRGRGLGWGDEKLSSLWFPFVLEWTSPGRCVPRSVRGPGNRVPGIQRRHDVAESSMAKGRPSPRVSGPKVLVIATIGGVARSVVVSPS